MSMRFAPLVVAFLPMALIAQQPAAPPPAGHDTLHQRVDTLTRKPIELAPVTVTAAPARREEPASAVRVSAAVLQQTPATNAYDLVRQTAGIEVHDQGQGPGFASDASVRGFSSDHSTDIALWVDGVPINEPVNGHAEGYNDWSLMFPQAVEDMDVIKGPTSAVYGNFAMAGVVNVRTLERMQGTSLWLNPGSYGRVDGGLLTGFDHTSSSGVFGLRGLREDGWRPNSGYTLGQGHGRYVASLTPATTLDLGVEVYGTKWDSPGFLTDSQYTAGLYDLVTNSTDGGFKRRGQERASLRVLVNPSLLWRTTAYATQGRWQLYLTIPPEPGSGEGTGSQTEEEDHRYGFGLTSALTWALSRSEVTLGIEGRWDHSRYENWLTTDRMRDSAQALVTARQASGALLAQTSTDITPHLRVTLGARFDGLNTRSEPDSGVASDAGKTLFSPKVGVLYHLPGLAYLYGNVSRGFRATDGVIEDPTLPFITEWAYEVGVKLDRRRVSASVALFQVDVSNEQTFDPVTLASTSGGSSRRRGVELELTARPTDAVTLTAYWTFNDARYRQLITEDGDTLDGARVYNTATYVGTVSLSVAPPHSVWRLGVSSNALGPYSPFDEPGVVRPAYGLVHLSGGLTFGRAALDAGVRNLFDQAYRELEAGGFVSPGQPRTVYGALRYVW